MSTLTSAVSIEWITIETVQALPTGGPCGVVNAVDAQPSVCVTHRPQGRVNIAITGAKITHPHLMSVCVEGGGGGEEERSDTSPAGHIKAS